ncbi:MAG: PspC domain-containing protein [Sediminibacterium sp.]|nr:PspC domain-containing protein [Sediminibacterium sp.]MBP6144969.1 PspC domain-containing protein [Sediminibacterium sp.]
MKKVININFQGRILPIEEMAYENLKQYIESLRAYFEQEEGKDEIINDIECRVAELCEDRLKKGAVCITSEDIELIITSIGRPADFEAQDGFEANSNTNANAGQTFSNTQQNAGPTYHKRLYRDEQNKVLGGVCSGIANYFNVDPLVVRILWILLAGVNLLAYLILWIAVPSSSVKEVGGVRKRLFRDIDHKIIGGVCAGLSKYFGVRVGVIRILFLIPTIVLVTNWNHFHLFQFWEFDDFSNFMGLTFSPGAVFLYIVLWLVLPEAKTSADKLEMVGEKVDINSIKNTIQTDMEGFSKRAQTWSSSFDKYKKPSGENGPNNASNPTPNEQAALEQRKGCMYYFSKTITILMKAFVYFILGIITISVLAALFGIGVATTGLLPLKKFILEEGLQTWAFIGTILLFIWVPVVAIVTSIVRKIAGFKKANIWVRSSFIALWSLGWVCLFYFMSSLGNSFSKHNQPNEQAIVLANPAVDYLEVTASPKMKYYEQRWFNIEPFQVFNDDTVRVRNLKIRIVQSKTDSFEVKYVTMSNGKSISEANMLAQKINFSVTQQDSILMLDRGIAITKTDKFRNQHVIMTIAVPVGKRFKITNKGWSQTNIRVNSRGIHSETMNHFGGDDIWVDEWNENWDNESYSYDRGVEYKMTKDGLERIKSEFDEDEVDDYQTEDGNIDEMEQQLEKLKRDRENLEQDLEKTRAQKVQELEKIDRALEEKKAEKKGAKKEAEMKKTQQIAVGAPTGLSKVAAVAQKAEDLHLLIQRFTY